MSEPLYVLIGGGGFMGGAYAAHLQRAGHEVLVVRRSEPIADFAAHRRLIAGTRRCVIVDFAYTSVPNSSFSDPVRDYSDNLYNLLRHVDFAKALPGATYVYVSSGGTVYGNPSSNMPIAEEHRNIPLAPYGITKLACERYVLMYREVHGLDVRIVRPSNVYGPRQQPYRGQGIVATVMARLLEAKTVQIYGDGSTVRDYLYIDDFCAAMDDVVCAGANGEVYNLGSGIGVSIMQLLALLKAETGVNEIKIDRLAARPFDVQYNVLDSAKLARLNHWRPTVSLERGLARTARWLADWLKPSGGTQPRGDAPHP